MGSPLTRADGSEFDIVTGWAHEGYYNIYFVKRAHFRVARRLPIITRIVVRRTQTTRSRSRHIHRALFTR